MARKIPTPKDTLAKKSEATPKPKTNPFKAKLEAPKEAPAKQPAVAATPKANPFIGKRDTKQAPLHAEPTPELIAPKAKSFSFYPEDVTRLVSLRKKFTDRSGPRHVPDSVVVRVALAYLEDQLNTQDGNEAFERQFRSFLLEHR